MFKIIIIDRYRRNGMGHLNKTDDTHLLKISSNRGQDEGEEEEVVSQSGEVISCKPPQILATWDANKLYGLNFPIGSCKTNRQISTPVH